MNIFILNSGRCGSYTFIQACRHITNYTAGHETRLRKIGAARLAYPPRHIEADNRLSWLLGRLDQAYGHEAYYLHLAREPANTAASFARRAGYGIMRAYREGLLLDGEPGQSDLAVAEDYLLTVEANIQHFLRDKPHRMHFRLENAEADFRAFWGWIGAEGDLDAALAEWSVRYNAAGDPPDTR